MVAALELAPTAEVHADAAWRCDNQALTPLGETDTSGRGTLCATPFALLSEMNVRGLNVGDAYTVWWVYIDDPTCTMDPNPLACFMGDNPVAVFGRMDGVVAKSGRPTHFSGELRSFSPAAGSQIWLLLFGHGPADHVDNRHLARQLLTPEDPNAGAPHLGIVGGPVGEPAAVIVFAIPD